LVFSCMVALFNDIIVVLRLLLSLGRPQKCLGWLLWRAVILEGAVFSNIFILLFLLPSFLA